MITQPMDPAALYQRLGSLLSNAPNLRDVTANSQTPQATLEWLAKLSAVGEHLRDVTDNMELRLAAEELIRTHGMRGASRVMLVANRMLARAEIAAPAAAAGSFITAGRSFDALATVAKILGDVTSHVLIVDPYMDASALTRVAVLVPEGRSIGLLTDKGSLKPGLKPAADAWVAQYRDARPLKVVAAPRRTLHDRLILADNDAVWILTQSLEHFAARSPATIQRSDPETTVLKFEAYTALWNSGTIIASS